MPELNLEPEVFNKLAKILGWRPDFDDPRLQAQARQDRTEIDDVISKWEKFTGMELAFEPTQSGAVYPLYLLDPERKEILEVESLVNPSNPEHPNFLINARHPLPPGVRWTVRVEDAYLVVDLIDTGYQAIDSLLAFIKYEPAAVPAVRGLTVRDIPLPEELDKLKEALERSLPDVIPEEDAEGEAEGREDEITVESPSDLDSPDVETVVTKAPDLVEHPDKADVKAQNKDELAKGIEDDILSSPALPAYTAVLAQGRKVLRTLRGILEVERK